MDASEPEVHTCIRCDGVGCGFCSIDIQTAEDGTMRTPRIAESRVLHMQSEDEKTQHPFLEEEEEEERGLLKDSTEIEGYANQELTDGDVVLTELTQKASNHVFDHIGCKRESSETPRDQQQKTKIVREPTWHTDTSPFVAHRPVGTLAIARDHPEAEDQNSPSNSQGTELSLQQQNRTSEDYQKLLLFGIQYSKKTAVNLLQTNTQMPKQIYPTKQLLRETESRDQGVKQLVPAKTKKSDSLGDLTLKPTETQAEVENTLDKKKVAAEPEEKLDDLTSAPCDDDTLMYRLSNPVCMNLGWTVKLEETSARLLDGNQRGLEDNCKVIDTTAQRNALNIEDTTSSQWLTNGMIGHAELGNIEQRYSDGSLFITSFTDKSGTVFYPNGAPAMVLLPVGEGDARTTGLLCLVHEVVHRTGKKSDKRKDADRENVKNADKINKMTAGRMLAVLSTLGYGTIYDSDGRIRFQYNSTGGMQFAEKAVDQACNVTKRRWNWSGDPHTHAPPFQSVTIRINRNIHFVATRKERIYVHFQHGDRRCRIDVSMSQ